jgi:hypothetical protein
MSSPHVQPTVTLTHAGALTVLEGAVTEAAELGVPQRIAVVDRAGAASHRCLASCPISNRRHRRLPCDTPAAGSTMAA